MITNRELWETMKRVYDNTDQSDDMWEDNFMESLEQEIYQFGENLTTRVMFYYRDDDTVLELLEFIENLADIGARNKFLTIEHIEEDGVYIVVVLMKRSAF